jgi:YqjK-like protein
VSYGDQISEVMRERERLLARCDAQRAEIAVMVPQFEGPLRIADRVIAGINYLRHHPVILGVLVAALTIVQRRHWWSWAKRGFVLWRAYRTFLNSRSKLAV